MMKRRLVAAAALLTLAACAQTPKQVMTEGRESEHVLKRPPVPAAHCMARNIENFRPSSIAASFTPTVRPLEPDGMEVLAQIMAADATTIAVTHLTPAGPGSTAHIWFTARPIIHGYKESIAAFIEGC